MLHVCEHRDAKPSAEKKTDCEVAGRVLLVGDRILSCGRLDTVG